MSFFVESTFCDSPLKVVSFAVPNCIFSFVSRRDCIRESNESVIQGDLLFDELEFEASFSNLANSFKDASMMSDSTAVQKPQIVERWWYVDDDLPPPVVVEGESPGIVSHPRE